MTATVSPITSGAPEAPEANVSLSDYVPYRLATASAAVSRLIARAYEDRFGLTIP
ncbi:MAG: MarR family transcriptional regulator, partial [Caulobacter vibrioides]